MAKFTVTAEQAAKAINENGMVAVVVGKSVEFGFTDQYDADFSGVELSVLADSEQEAVQKIAKRAKQVAALYAK